MEKPKLKKAVEFGRDLVFELLWPTRCAVCDITGADVICKRCMKNLKVVDKYLACPKCGAPFGIVQCTECNDLLLKSCGLEKLPFDSMSHAYILDDAAKRIVSAYKDHNERRLSTFIAQAICHHINPDIIRENYAITYIPDSKEAYRRRGFDHSLEIAQEAADMLGLECKCLFNRPSSADQRKLDRSHRIENMTNTLKICDNCELPDSVIVLDDVCTTGATIYAACIELKRCGVKRISAVTFGRMLA